MSLDLLVAAVRNKPRIIIAGGPRTGKSTLALKLAERLGYKRPEAHDQRGAYFLGARSTDELIEGFDWSQSSAEVAKWFAAPGPWIIEGVVTPRAIRKWFAARHGTAPCDVVVWVETAKVPQTRGQAAMHRGCNTVFVQVTRDLYRAGVPILSPDGRRLQ